MLADWVKPICLPTSSDVAAKSYVGKKLWVAGWGKTETRKYFLCALAYCMHCGSVHVDLNVLHWMPQGPRAT